MELAERGADLGVAAEMDDRVEGDDALKIERPERPGSVMVPTSNVISGWSVRARSIIDGERSMPVTVSPRAARNAPTWPGPHPMSQTRAPVPCSDPS